MALSLGLPDSFVRRFPASTIAVHELFCERADATACHRISPWQMAAHDFVNTAAKRERGRAPELSLVFTGPSRKNPTRCSGRIDAAEVRRGAPPSVKFREISCPKNHARF